MRKSVLSVSKPTSKSLTEETKFSLELHGLFIKDEDNFVSYVVQDEEILKPYLNDHDLFF